MYCSTGERLESSLGYILAQSRIRKTRLYRRSYSNLGGPGFSDNWLSEGPAQATPSYIDHDGIRGIRQLRAVPSTRNITIVGRQKHDLLNSNSDYACPVIDNRFSVL